MSKKKPAASNFVLMALAISLIKPKQGVSLREAKVDTEEFEGLVASIRERGFLGSITVRPAKDEDGNEFYEIIDGLQRYTAACHAGLEEIPCNVTNRSELETLEDQIAANEHGVATRPAEYAAQLLEIIRQHPERTQEETCKRLGIGSARLNNLLKLNKLADDIKPLVDDGKITLTNAVQLSKLPEEEQASHVDAAMTEDTTDFAKTITSRKAEIAKAAREGREAKPKEFVPRAKLRNLSDVEAAIKEGVMDVETLKWVANLDDASVEAQRDAWEAKEAKAAAKREEAKLARVKKKEEAAAAERAQLEAEAAAAQG